MGSHAWLMMHVPQCTEGSSLCPRLRPHAQATLLAGWLLLLPSLPAEGHAWLAAQSALLLFASARCLRGTVPRWHELLAALLRLNGFGFGVTSRVGSV